MRILFVHNTHALNVSILARPDRTGAHFNQGLDPRLMTVSILARPDRTGALR